MKKLLLLILPALFSLSLSAQGKPEQSINWMSFEEAIAANADGSKKIFVDVYTDWCGWCKRMDATTFKDPHVIAEINAHYLPVKFDAESREPVTVGDSVYRFLPRGNRGTHSLAVALLNGKLTYPTVVVLDEKFNLLQPLVGYYTGKDLEPILRYLGNNAWYNQEYPAWMEENPYPGKP